MADKEPVRNIAEATRAQKQTNPSVWISFLAIFVVLIQFSRIQASSLLAGLLAANLTVRFPLRPIMYSLPRFSLWYKDFSNFCTIGKIIC
jgi:hypothetical protein